MARGGTGMSGRTRQCKHAAVTRYTFCQARCLLASHLGALTSAWERDFNIAAELFGKLFCLSSQTAVRNLVCTLFGFVSGDEQLAHKVFCTAHGHDAGIKIHTQGASDFRAFSSLSLFFFRQKRRWLVMLVREPPIVDAAPASPLLRCKTQNRYY